MMNQKSSYKIYWNLALLCCALLIPLYIATYILNRIYSINKATETSYNYGLFHITFNLILVLCIGVCSFYPNEQRNHLIFRVSRFTPNIIQVMYLVDTIKYRYLNRKAGLYNLDD